ncbi:MAG TPA: S8 family serine peptidase, partial [Nocardioides sp.]|nr:S8 family serine peptidase [Nocardioides sp.]
MSVARRGAGLVATAIACAGLTVPIGPPAYAEEGACSEIQADTEDVDEVKAPSVPLEELGIERATELLEREGRAPGEGVGVAVVDSGIADVARVNEQGGLDPKSEFAKSPSPVYFHGTAVAGLIAGQPRPDGGDVGIAPAASLYDVTVYDDVADSDDGALLGLTDAGVIDGLNRIADNPRVGQVPIRIVNVSLALQPSPRLEAAVNQLTKKGIVVVAASGNRPTSE